MLIPDVLPLSPPSTSSRRKTNLLSSSAKSTNTPSLESSASFTGSRKRVGFATAVDAPNDMSSQPPPSDARHSGLRSILKAGSETTIQTTNGSQDEDQPMIEMMECFVELLARNDRATSVDAYQTLCNVIQRYNDIPEDEVLKKKINTFISYIKRDLLRKASPEEPLVADTNLMTQALRLLIIFVWNKDYASLLSDDSRIFVLDRSIQVLTEHTAPKGVVVHYLHLLAAQNFRQALVTGHRVARLLEALKPLSEHYSGHSVISERLLVYQKLLDQERPTMKAKAHLWIEELLSGTTNTLKDIRVKAVNLGLKACAAFPASSSISAVVKSTLAKDVGNQRTFSSSMCHRLEKMVAVKEAIQVPQIWTIVLSLCNDVDRTHHSWGSHCDKWPQLKEWLNVIQKCFNCSEAAVKQQAYQAWNRFIHIVQPHSTSDNLLQLLAKPVISNLERHRAEAATKGPRIAAISNYCTLLYYAFRPAATHEQYTRVWNDYIMKVLKSSFLDKSAANADIVSRILMALFWGSNKATKIWNESRVLESTLIEPEELPTIDCKWIRSKARAILDVFRVLMRFSSWGASGQSEKAHIVVAWLHFLRALREASKKEIKPSPETVEAMIHLTSFLGRLYLHAVEDGEQHAKAHALSVAQIRRLTSSAVAVLGHDLILVGLSNYGHSLSKALVIYDALNSNLAKSQQAGELTTAIFDACLNLLDLSLVDDLKSKTNTATDIAIEQLQDRLEHSSAELVVQTLTLLKRPTVLLLKQDLSDWKAKDQHDSSLQYPRIIGVILALLADLPLSYVEQLDEILAALCGTTHQSVVEDTVKMWSQWIGQQPYVTLGPLLSKALVKLQESGVEISILGRPVRSELNESGMSPQAAHRDAPSAAVSEYTSPNPSRLLPGAEISPELGSRQVQSLVAEEDTAATSRPAYPTMRTRLRHDDSQVHFVLIESSPPPEEEPESQLLTIHQKEVRNRQRAEPAVVFPDLRSSPRRRASQSNSDFARKVASQPERPATPTLPANDDQGEEEIMASPTPRARHIAMQIADVEVPSSPPLMMGKNQRHEITSSPPQPTTNDVEDPIDLAMEQSEAACAQNTSGLNELGQMHASEGQVVVTAAISQISSHNMVQTGISREPSPHQLDQGTTNLASDIQPAGAVPQTSKNCDSQEAWEGLGHPQQREGQLDNAEEDLPQPDPTLCPSLSPVAINSASDSTATDRPENLAPSPVGQARTNSNEIDILSASQLSHDLDQHISLVVETEADESQIEGRLDMKAEQPEEDQERNQKKSRARKRKSSSQKSTATKRRKSSQGPSQMSSNSAEADSSVDGTPGEMLDCIEVSPSQAVQAVALSEPNESGPAPRRRRGRPRKLPLVEVLVPEASHVKMETTDERETDDAAALADAFSEGRDEVPGQDIEMPEVATTARSSPIMEITTNELTQVVSREDNTAADILASLRSVLDRLKSADPADIDLRKVDDLCFQIRFQAQIIAQQPGLDLEKHNDNHGELR